MKYKSRIRRPRIGRKRIRKTKIRRVKIYNKIYGMMSKNYREWIEQYMIYSGLKIRPENYVGFTIFYAMGLGFATLLLPIMGLIPWSYSSLAFFLAGTGFLLLTHFILVMAADNRTKLVEELLPDVLRLIASNIRSGLTIDKALLVSARQEFGPLEKQLNIASKETLSGMTIDRSLLRISYTFNSKLLSRSVELLSEGLKRGGDLAKLLESLSDDISQIKILKKDVQAMVMMYVIFIFFAAGIGAPLLYAISGFLVNTMGQIGIAVQAEEALATVGTNLPISTPQLSKIDPEFLNLYSIIALTITSIFGGLLIGLVQEGSERAGLKFIPMLLFISIALYYASKALITIAFGSIAI